MLIRCSCRHDSNIPYDIEATVWMEVITENTLNVWIWTRVNHVNECLTRKGVGCSCVCIWLPPHIPPHLNNGSFLYAVEVSWRWLVLFANRLQRHSQISRVGTVGIRTINFHRDILNYLLTVRRLQLQQVDLTLLCIWLGVSLPLLIRCLSLFLSITGIILKSSNRPESPFL